MNMIDAAPSAVIVVRLAGAVLTWVDANEVPG